MNDMVAIGAVADAVTGGVVGGILNGIKNSADIARIVTSGKVPTLDDAALIAARVPVLGDIVKGFGKAKDLANRAKNGDDDACYRTNWELSPKKECKGDRSKFLNFICMDSCPPGKPICPVFGAMCATEKYCSYFKEEVVADLITTGVTIAAVAGSGGLAILTLFQQILTLSEKFGHPTCDKKAAQIKGERDAAKKLLAAESKKSA